MKSATDLIQEAANEFCENYCKFLDRYAEKYEDPDEAEEALEREQCDVCVLRKLV